MKYIRHSQAAVIENGAVTAWEYEFADLAMNVARIRVNGRYPRTGFTSNREVDSIVHVINGQGILGIKGDARVELIAHVQVYLARGDAYFFEGDLELLYVSTPKWTSSQTEPID